MGGNGMNILICDDDREIVGAIEVYLKNDTISLKPMTGSKLLTSFAERKFI